MGNLLLDASSPAVVWNGPDGTVISGSFTPPAGALLVAAWCGNNGSGNSPGVPFINTTGLTWTLIHHSVRPDTPVTDGQVAMWWAVVPTSVSMTVAVTNDDIATGGAIKVWVWTDDSGGTPEIGATKENGRASSGTSVSDSVTATTTGSRGVIAYTDWAAPAGTPTAGTGCTLTGGGAANQGTLTYAFALRTTADGVAASSITMNLTTPNTSTNRWVIAEVTPAAAPAAPGYGTPPITWWPGDGPNMTERFTPDPRSQEPPIITDVNADAEDTTHDHTTGDPAPSIADTDTTNPDISHTTADPVVSAATTDGTAPAVAHQTGDPDHTLAVTDTTNPTHAVTAGSPTPGVGTTDPTAPTVGHTTSGVTATQTTTDSGNPSIGHQTGDPTPTHTIPAGDAVVTHQAFDATTSTATLTNVNAELTTHDVVAGDVTGTQTTPAGPTSHTHSTPDASTSLAPPTGVGTTSHTAGDPLAGVAVTDPVAPTVGHTSQPVTPTHSVSAGDAVIGHTALDATTSTASIVNANAEDTTHTVTAGDTTATVGISAGHADTTHTTYDTTISTTASSAAGAGATTHTTGTATPGVGGTAQSVSHTHTTHDTTTSHTTLAELVSVALVAFDAIVTTALAPPAYIGVDGGTGWGATLDNPYAIGASSEGSSVQSLAQESGTQPHGMVS